MAENHRDAPRDLEQIEGLQLRFDVPSDGWLGLELGAGNVRYTESFSHIYPSLLDLCSALCDLLNGVTARTVVFLLEPAELEMKFAPADQDSIVLGSRSFVTSEISCS